MGTTTKLLVLDQLAGNLPTSLSPLQAAMNAHLQTLIDGWWLIWFVTAFVLLAFLMRDYVGYRKDR